MIVRQATLVSLYRQKPKELVSLITRCQSAIAETPGIKFASSNLQQIHATIIGLEKVVGSSMHNLNLAKYRHQSGLMDICGFVDFLRASGQVLFQVQIGGFKNRDYPFTSRGQRPYDRSFLIQGNKAVMIGWPVQRQLCTSGSSSPNLLRDAQTYPSTLDHIRHAAQAFNICHTYHRAPTDIDNDFYFRIGLVAETDDLPRKSLEGRIRELLSQTGPIIVDITVSDLCIAAYEDETLPSISTKVWLVQDTKLTSESIWSLYE